MLEISQSELKTWNRCPKSWEYKYLQKLESKRRVRPLFTGSWVHACLETYYKEGYWEVGHHRFLSEYNKLFDEEKVGLDRFGRLPDVVSRIIRSYLWYYRNDDWKIILTEYKFKVELKSRGRLPILLKGIVDLVEEDEDGLWVVDHKTGVTIPEPTAFHAMDPQLMIYPWALKKSLQLDITGVKYNYVKSKAPGDPKINKDGSLSRRRVVTDYPTLMRFFKREGIDPQEYVDVLRPLQRRSPFLRRYKLPREQRVTEEILRDILTVTDRMQQSRRYNRVITRECNRQCSYHDLCRAELNGFDSDAIRRDQFTVKEADGDLVTEDLDGDEAEET